MGDRVAVIKDGYLQQVDTPQDLYDRPSNIFVAAFIGSPSMNLYEATLSVAGDGAVISLGDQRLDLPPALLAAHPGLRGYHGKQVAVGIRPEDFDDAEFASGATEGRILTAQVNLLESLGSEIMVHFRLDAPNVESGDPDVAQTATSERRIDAVGRFNPRSRVRKGDTARIAVATENLHFFDLDTRLAIWD